MDGTQALLPESFYKKITAAEPRDVFSLKRRCNLVAQRKVRIKMVLARHNPHSRDDLDSTA